MIPGSMGTRSYIVSGKGNAASYNSCSHGAGRRMSRTQAKRSLTVESLRAAMGDRAWNTVNAEALLDEHPDSYKDIDQVMADQQGRSAGPRDDRAHATPGPQLQGHLRGRRYWSRDATRPCPPAPALGRRGRGRRAGWHRRVAHLQLSARCRPGLDRPGPARGGHRLAPVGPPPGVDPAGAPPRGIPGGRRDRLTDGGAPRPHCW